MNAESELIQKKKAILIGVPGAGKTRITLRSAKQVGGNFLVISPLALVNHWKTEAETEGLTASIWQGGKKVINQITITNIDNVRVRVNDFVKEKFSGVILDESILVKNRKAKRTLAVLKLIQSIKPEYIWLLSGHPISQGVQDLFSQLKIIDPRRFSSFWTFVQTYCKVQQGFWGWEVEDYPESLDWVLRDYHMYFVHVDYRPPVPYEIVYLDYDLDKETEKIYRTMQDSFLAVLSPDQTIIARNTLSKLVRLAQITSGLYTDKAFRLRMDLLKSIVEIRKTLVWTFHVKMHEKVKEEVEEKAEVLQIGAGKYGLNYPDTNQFFFEQRFGTEGFVQSLFRSIRRTSTLPSTIYIPRAHALGKPTIDHVIAEVNENGNITMQKLFEILEV